MYIVLFFQTISILINSYIRLIWIQSPQLFVQSLVHVWLWLVLNPLVQWIVSTILYALVQITIINWWFTNLMLICYALLSTIRIEKGLVLEVDIILLLGNLGLWLIQWMHSELVLMMNCHRRGWLGLVVHGPRWWQVQLIETLWILHMMYWPWPEWLAAYIRLLFV